MNMNLEQYKVFLNVILNDEEAPESVKNYIVTLFDYMNKYLNSKHKNQAIKDIKNSAKNIFNIELSL